MVHSEFHQAEWHEPLLFELSRPGMVSHHPPPLEPEIRDAMPALSELLPKSLFRGSPPSLPTVPEPRIVRHYTRLSQMNYSVTVGTYPLGSCTMKYNPVVDEILASMPEFAWVHPYQDPRMAQGTLEMMWELQQWLAEITGMDEVTLQPSAGAQGEMTGALIIREYHRQVTGEWEARQEMIIPDAAHGTNPASATMAGFKVVVVPSDSEGLVDIDALKEAVGPRTAGLMLTNPNTIGVFEKNIEEIGGIVHDAGGLLYYDGANLNAIMGIVRPGDMGFDVVHLNLHKTFSTPHGGGGPGAGPVGVKKDLADFLPVPVVVRRQDGFFDLDYDRPKSIGKVHGFYGNVGVLLRAYAYIYAMGQEGLRRASEVAVLNANYVAHHIRQIRGFSLPCSEDTPRMHECVISATALKKETGVSALNVAKRLLDFGVHAPTIYFPLIVDEALMIEPTESESKEELDRFIEAIAEISREAYEDPEIVLTAPHNASIRLLDEYKAAHPSTLTLSWRMHLRKQQEHRD